MNSRMLDQVRGTLDRILYGCLGLVAAGCLAYALGVLPDAWKALARPLLLTGAAAAGVGHALPVVRNLLRERRMRWLRRFTVAAIAFSVTWEAVGPGSPGLEDRILEAFMRYLLPLAGPVLLADAAEGWWRGLLTRAGSLGFAGAGLGVLLVAGAGLFSGGSAMLVAGLLGIVAGGLVGGLSIQEIRAREAAAALLPSPEVTPGASLSPAAHPPLS